MQVDHETVDMVLGYHLQGRPVLLRRTAAGGHVKIKGGYLRFLTRRIDVDTATYDAIKAGMSGASGGGDPFHPKAA